jgi:hypothetical protein
LHRTEAHALAAILRAVNESEKKSLRQKWGEALGQVHPSSVELSRRHAETVSLLTSTLRQVHALPEDKQSTYIPFTQHWWTAVVCPDAQWNATGTGPVIAQEHLALLSNLGDFLEARLEHTAAAPGGFNLAEVRTQCHEWTAALDDDLLPAALARSLGQAIQHLSWVIDNAELFGAAHVAAVANDLTGDMVLTTRLVPPARRREWAARLGKWTATLMAFSAFATATAAAVERTDVLVKEISQVAVQLVDQVTDAPPGLDSKAIEGAT